MANKVTLDEVAGFLVTMFAIDPTLKTVAAGFFLFRFFDVAKLFPARLVERKAPGGWGITFDDIIAGLWAQLILRLLLHFGLLA
ncbi:MAG TPA: phosphatidylglycerophosphatase A, partial [bacterium]|nr:phosphatidylglycerophosphatase A [bacterium]